MPTSHPHTSPTPTHDLATTAAAQLVPASSTAPGSAASPPDGRSPPC